MSAAPSPSGSAGQKKKEIGAPSAPQNLNALKLPLGHEDSEYMLSFEIGQREGGFYSAKIDTQTDRITEPPSSVLVYRCQ